MDFPVERRQFNRSLLKLFDFYSENSQKITLERGGGGGCLHETVSVVWKASLTYRCSAREKLTMMIAVCALSSSSLFIAVFKCAFVINISWKFSLGLSFFVCSFLLANKNSYNLCCFSTLSSEKILQNLLKRTSEKLQLFFFFREFIYLRKLGRCG